MRICMLSTMYLRYKGDTRGLMVYELNRNLIKNGFDIEVVAPNSFGYKNFEILDNVKVHRFNYFFPKSLQKLAYGAGIPTNIRKSFLAKIQVPFFVLSFLFKAIKVSKNCDVIHAQWVSLGLIALLAKFFVKKPVVVTVRRVSNQKLMRWIDKFILENADFVIFNSSYTMKESLKIVKPIEYSVIYNSVDTDKFKKIKTNLKERLGIKSDTKIVFFLGLLVEKKGVKYLIEAFKKVVSYYENVVLIIGGHGSEYDNLKNLSNNLGILDKILFIGEINSENTPHFYNIADVFVLPSIIDSKGETETLGVVLLEAMACGVPVVASNVGGIPDIVDSKVGFLVKQKSPKKLAQKILKLLKNEKLRKKLGEAGRRKVLEKFSPEKQIKKIIKIYRYVLG